MSTFSLSIDNRNNYNLFDNYLNNNKSIKPLLPSENTCFSEEESDSSNSAKSFKSNNKYVIKKGKSIHFLGEDKKERKIFYFFFPCKPIRN
jgi:hypothetical protein